MGRLKYFTLVELPPIGYATAAAFAGYHLLHAAPSTVHRGIDHMTIWRGLRPRSRSTGPHKSIPAMSLLVTPASLRQTQPRLVKYKRT